MIWTKKFWKGLAERAVKTFAQAGVAAAGVGAVGNTTGLTDINWLQVLSIAACATILSAAMSIGNADFTSGVDTKVASNSQTAVYPITMTTATPGGIAADPDKVVINDSSR